MKRSTRRFVLGVLVGVALGAAATATATTARTVYLNRGDIAVPTAGETLCTVRPWGGSRNGFVCQVGGDYRAKYGVIVNERYVAVTQYTTFNRYRLLVRRTQSPIP
jgi:hypothetical protein